MLAEPIHGRRRLHHPPKEYFEIAVGIVRKYGGVFICDEVQTGFGRTGGRMWGIEHWNVEPDIMTMAKGIANGMPLGVTIATPEIADVAQGAHDLDLRRQPDLVAPRRTRRSRSSSARSWRALRNAWAGACATVSMRSSAVTRASIGDVRGMGLMQGVELVEDETAGDRTPRRRPRPSALRGDEEARAADRQGRARRQRAAHRAALDGRRGRDRRSDAASRGVVDGHWRVGPSPAAGASSASNRRVTAD